jgi:phage terminase large subunit-like protein
LTRLAASALLALRGVQSPRIERAPDAVFSSAAGDEACDFARAIGVILEPWQEYVLRLWLGERPDGSWAASSAVLVVARQNGKGMVTAIRELAEVVLFGTQVKPSKVIHSAHNFDTSMEHMQLIESLVEASPMLKRQFLGKTMAHGSESLRFKSGLIRFKTRTRTGARGFAGYPLIVFDEAFELPENMFASMRPVITAVPNHQLVYTSSAVNQMQHPNGAVLARIRNRALNPVDGDRLAYAEWSLDDAVYEANPRVLAADPQSWAESNPALGYGRITAETLGEALLELGPDSFAAEHLSVGDWPDGTGGGSNTLDRGKWAALAEPNSAKALNPTTFALDVSPDRSSVTIAAAGWRDDGRLLVEVVDRVASPSGAVARIVKLVASHSPCKVVVDGYGGLADLLERQDVKFETTSASDVANACGRLVDMVNDGTLVHLGDPVLDGAVVSVKTRKLAGGFAWTRSAGGDVSPLVAVTLAAFGADKPAAVSSQPFVFVT